ncbi:MAG TPA: TIGR04076 family protein [Anaerolineaceae bacterium]|nr:TIGR04076 family protein [Anaerolineaceae bacterium]HNS37904.1 TIGR04076 family protein [Anaerolineaceae bacterium]HOD04843.1 TIGR04076 family protein [Anaerolineaceae bacterium]HQF63171.1 TIGR04076 family protein [Anaerolineaceae bacterium]HQH86156.1 TIGR04076 family protein [Anaerolineaceae bacterium]
MVKCKITVLKRGFNQDLVERYVEHERKKTLGPCEVFREGQEFITDVFGGIPAGFCPWAWDDIYKVLVGYAAGGNFGMWYEDGNCLIACCTDGTRPVYFKIEKIDEEAAG